MTKTTFKPGDLFSTGSEFFQVTRATKCTVTVRPIKSVCTGTTAVYTAFDYDISLEAKRDEFTTVWYFDDKQNANGRRCKVDPNGCIRLSSYYHIDAYPTNGHEIYNRNLG